MSEETEKPVEVDLSSEADREAKAAPAAKAASIRFLGLDEVTIDRPRIVDVAETPEEQCAVREILHMKRFMSGRMKPSEAHRQLGWRGRKCLVCGGLPALRIKVFMPADEAVKRGDRRMLMMMALMHEGGIIPTIDLQDPSTHSVKKYIKASDVFACDNCKVVAERQAAKAPSWCVVEIDRGVKDTIQVAMA